MRILIISFFVFAFINLYSQHNLIPREYKNSHENQNISKQLIENYSKYDIFYQRMYFEVDPNVRFVKGEVGYYFKVIDEYVNNLMLEISDSLYVDSIKFRDNILNFSHINSILDINIDVTIYQNIIDSIVVYYHGIPEKNNDFVSFFQGLHNNQYPIITTMSEPYSAKCWMPSKQSLSDKIDSLDIIIKTPQEYTAVSNGLLLSKTIDGVNAIFHWKHKHPVCYYLIAFAVTNYQLYTVKVSTPENDTIVVDNYLYPENYSTESQKADWIQNIFDFFDSKIIPYPYKNEKYGHALWENPGGMEHQTVSFMKSLDYGLMVHELAHQWFGNYITCGSWKDIWLNEGLATYFSILIEQHYNSVWYKPLILEKIDHVCSQPDGSVYCYDTSSVERVFSPRLSYSKGAMVLHNLRWEIGDSSFFKAINNYLKDTLLANKIAFTSDLKNHFEQVADTNLTEFFNDWIYGQGYPTYIVNWQQDENKKVTVNINQQTTDNSVSFFDNKIPLKLKNSSTDTILVLVNNLSNQTFEYQIEFNVDSIIFDPYNVIITKNPIIQNINNFKIINDISTYPNPAIRFLYIQTPSNEKIISIELISLLGEMINIRYLINESFIDLLDIKSGLYFLKIKTNKQEIIQKVIIQK